MALPRDHGISVKTRIQGVQRRDRRITDSVHGIEPSKRREPCIVARILFFDSSHQIDSIARHGQHLELHGNHHFPWFTS